MHHLHDLHHVQVNGFTLTLSNSQHCINHNLQVHEKMVVIREREKEREREGYLCEHIGHLLGDLGTQRRPGYVDECLSIHLFL